MINLINLSPTDLNKPIYRIFQLERFLDSFIFKTNDLIDTNKWEDPFENYIFNLPRVNKDGKITNYIHSQFFGQCWTLNVETDFMWRAYTTNKESVKVKSTISKLIKSLESSLEYNEKKIESDKLMKEYEDAGGTSIMFFDCSIGRVDYKKTQEFIKMNNSRRLGKEYFSKPLFMKRYQFRHEREVRIVIDYLDSDLHKYESGNPVFSYNIDPNFLFDEIVFDPRMNEKKYESFKMFLQKNGYRNKIIQSGLYKLPFNTINE
jgi:hypothetical protein